MAGLEPESMKTGSWVWPKGRKNSLQDRLNQNQGRAWINTFCWRVWFYYELFHGVKGFWSSLSMSLRQFTTVRPNPGTCRGKMTAWIQV